MATKNVTVVRPYDERIREKMFAYLEAAGLEVLPDHVIPEGTSDDEALRSLAGEKGNVLLIPFHAHRDESGKRTNGLELAKRIEKELPVLNDSPILMPVSDFAAAGVRLMLTQSEEPISDDLRRRTLFISEADLEDPSLARTIRDHVSGVSVAG